MKVVCVIPARYSSTRLPGKPLADIAGKPMIQHVWERAKQARRPDEVIVATDHEQVFNAVRAFGGQAVMTSPRHLTGTDRLAEVAARLDDVEIIVNVQGDEPLIAPEVIDQLAGVLAGAPDLVMATLAASSPTWPATPCIFPVRSSLIPAAGRPRRAFTSISAFMPIAGIFSANSPRCRPRRWKRPSRSNSCGRWSTATASRC